MNMHYIDMWHQAVGHYGGPHHRANCHVLDQIQALRQSDTSDQNVLPGTVLLQGLDQVYKKFAGAVARLCEINVADIHISLRDRQAAPRAAPPRPGEHFLKDR